MKNTTQAVIATEMIVLAQTVDKYCKCISNRMLAKDDATLRALVNMEKFSEALIKGWKVWNREEEGVFETSCTANFTYMYCSLEVLIIV